MEHTDIKTIYDLLAYSDYPLWIQGYRTRLVIFSDGNFLILAKTDDTGTGIYKKELYEGMGEYAAVQVFIQNELKD